MTVSATSMKLVFPEFANADPAQIEFAIAEAARGVDSTWIEGDRDRAQMFLAAHHLMVAKQRAASATGQKIKSERIGELSVTYADDDKTVTADAGDYSTTAYGARYLQLRRVNIPAIAVV